MFFTRLPTEKELAGTGFTPDDYAEEAEVWPENWPTFHLFSLMSKQWDTGIAGPTCLKYPVLFELMDRQGLKGDSWWEMLDEIRAMESAALKAIHDNKPD